MPSKPRDGVGTQCARGDGWCERDEIQEEPTASQRRISHPKGYTIAQLVLGGNRDQSGAGFHAVGDCSESGAMIEIITSRVTECSRSRKVPKVHVALGL